MKVVSMESKQAATQGHRAVFRTPDGGKAKTVLVLLCLVVIVVGATGAFFLIRTAPKVNKRPPVKMTPLVRVQAVYPEAQTVVIDAMGTVVPALELTLKSRVAGEIVAVHPEFIQGGVLRRGDQILRIDDVDYTLIVARKQSAVVDARYALKVELGRQEIAQREWALLNGGNPAPENDVELALRKPHLEKARSDVTAAEADLEAARLQLARTRIQAPFNAVIRQTHVEKGSQVAAQENLAALVGTDEYWVRVSVPVDRLQWIDIPNSRQQRGAAVRIQYNGGAERSGRVMKLLSDLESEGRMARLLVTVKDPMGMEATGASLPAMLIGEYVRVAVTGRQIEAAYRIPRSALRDNTHIWLVDENGLLQIRQVRTIWRDSRSVVITNGLEPGERIVVSDLAAPVAGMTVKVDKGGAGPVKPAPSSGPKQNKG